jgi:hypothetical protein
MADQLYKVLSPPPGGQAMIKLSALDIADTRTHVRLID